jgi:hypothetical protein
VRGFGSTFRRLRAGGMSSSAFSCDGGGVRDRQVAGRIGEFGGELSGELGMELRGEERSEAASKYMSSWERAGRCCSGRCIRELGVMFQAVALILTRCESRTGWYWSPHDSLQLEGLRRPSVAVSSVKEKQ